MKFLNMLLIKSLAFALSAYSVSSTQNGKFFSVSGDINVAFIINDCQNFTDALSYSHNTLINSAIWTTERINFLEVISPLTLGLSVYQTCSEFDFIKQIFDLYKNDQNVFLSVVPIKETSGKIKKFADVLDIRTKTIKKYYSLLVKATVQFLKEVGWRKNIIVATTNENVMEIFYKYSRTARICIKECYIFDDSGSINLNATGEDPLVFFGTAADINQLIIYDPHLEDKYVADGIAIIFVPLDGDVPTGLPEGSFVILPPHSPPTNHKSNNNILPTPLLFEIAEPLLSLIISIKNILTVNCNDTVYKINCLRSKLTAKMELASFTLPSDILKTLRIDPLEEHFVYSIFKVENSKGNDTFFATQNIFLRPYRKIFTYNVFNDNLTLVDDNFEVPFFNDTEEILSGDICSQELIIWRNNRIFGNFSVIISFRKESWIYAFVSLSLLGILFCIAILIFVLVAIFQRQILEGNPVLTLLLLFSVMLIFCAVLPFSIENNKFISEKLCLIKTLFITLSYAALFSLLLSRIILLSTAAKEVGFMSHVAGPVQSFLCLFIFGIQAALNLQFVGRCKDIFNSYSFIYFLSYNVMLLLLLLCLIPLIYKSQRNYREGKYFSIAIGLIALIWCIWLPSFLLLCNDWREFMLCFGLVSTGGICLGAIFIPRTYLMTIAAERDKITSALPSLATATSAIDLYRAHTQPIYDCVNVAAINAATVARAGVTPSAPATTLQQPDLYSCPALPEDIDFDLRCDSPASTDKVTRF